MTFVTAKPTAYRRPALTIDRWLDEFMKPVFSTDWPRTRETAYPPVNVVENDEAFAIELAVPGLNKADIEVTVDQDVLLINGKREAEKNEEGETFRRREFGAYQFSRRFQLSDKVNAHEITAAYENGILTVTVPKREEAKPQPARRIELV